MSGFVPRTHERLTDAVIRASLAWHAADIAGRIAENDARAMLRQYIAEKRVAAVSMASSRIRAGRKVPLMKLTQEDRETASAAPREPEASRRLLVSSLSATWERIRGFLATGALHAWLVPDHGGFIAVPADDWMGERADEVHVYGRFSVAGTWNSIEGAPVVLRSDMDALIAGPESLEASSSPQVAGATVEVVASKKSKGGAPTKYDDFLIEAFVIMWSPGAPDNALELRKRVMDQWDKRGGAQISDKWARAKIDALWARLQEADGK